MDPIFEIISDKDRSITQSPIYGIIGKRHIFLKTIESIRIQMGVHENLSCIDFRLFLLKEFFVFCNISRFTNGIPDSTAADPRDSRRFRRARM